MTFCCLSLYLNFGSLVYKILPSYRPISLGSAASKTDSNMAGSTWAYNYLTESNDVVQGSIIDLRKAERQTESNDIQHMRGTNTHGTDDNEI